MFRFINHSVFDRRICVPIFYKKKTGDAPVGELSEYAYYFLMPFLGAATLMQIIRNGIAVGTKKNEK